MTVQTAAIEDKPKRVEDWENREVKGEALAHKRVLETRAEKAARLRQRQEAYYASLPKEPLEALADIHRSLMDMRELAEPQYGPRAALEIMYQLATHNAFDESHQLKEALYWLAIQGLDGLKLVEDAQQRASDIAAQFHPAYEPYRA
ncbi:MAG: hypothetical protein AAF376_00065 [Pseudomonadota bacterium]